MNPRLVKFMVELQNEEKQEKTTTKYISYSPVFFSKVDFAKIPVQVDNNK